MIMIWMKWDWVQIVGLFMLLFFMQDSIYYCYYIDVVVKVCCFVEGFWVCFMVGRVQMGKMDVIVKGFYYFYQIVIGVNVI